MKQRHLAGSYLVIWQNIKDQKANTVMDSCISVMMKSQTLSRIYLDTFWVEWSCLMQRDEMKNSLRILYMDRCAALNKRLHLRHCWVIWTVSEPKPLWWSVDLWHVFEHDRSVVDGLSCGLWSGGILLLEHWNSLKQESPCTATCQEMNNLTHSSLPDFTSLL